MEKTGWLDNINKNSFKVHVEYTAAIEVIFEKQCAISTLKGYWNIMLHPS